MTVAKTRAHARPDTAAHQVRNLEPLDECAARYGVSTRTLRRRIADGTITGYRVGSYLLRVDPIEVEAALVRPIATVATA